MELISTSNILQPTSYQTEHYPFITAQTMNVIKQLEYHIARREREQLIAVLDSLSLAEMDQPRLDKLQAYLLKFALTVNNDEALALIIDLYEQKIPLNYPTTVLTCLALNSCLSPLEIKTIYARFPQREGFDYFQDLVNMEEDDRAVLLAHKLIPLLPPLTHKEWSILVRLATPEIEDEEETTACTFSGDTKSTSTHLLRFFRAQLAQHTHAPPPTWLRSGPQPIIKDFGPFCTAYQAVESMLQDVENECVALTKPNKEIDIQELRETIIRHCSTTCLTVAQLTSTEFDPYDDKVLFQEFGPLNSVYSSVPETETDHICVKYGGCRMLLCTEYETRDDIGQHIDPFLDFDRYPDEYGWFRGACDKCDLIIDRPHYAVRVPLNHGGWSGCYCSWKCVEEDNPPCHPDLIQIIKDKLIVFGIRERD